eukprot:CAMPEP_0114341716 /NCGR_PEP_ID=MMETSP0101-20121206/9230_1 /TAXON_ID=38822 ORGANISM="Pteridomonas danica, Strain PT" /NCGR_SAMPLE_ID=MMETSP0101 /ASSEMBLY_ACC=CAM_ASM_000211 /LENGTH=460 /DNA_ID=CAMNT_0001475407 /DNA_START=56 /DNA_END=1436 /DNA_ORIENTATION=+
MSFDPSTETFSTPQGVAELPPTPKKVNTFSRTTIDEAFGSGTSNKGFTKHGKKTGLVAGSSPAVKEGLVMVCIDNKIDQRSAAVKKGLVKVDEDGFVLKNESLLCQDQIVFTQNGSISKTSNAVKNGIILLKGDGEVDKRCSAVKNGWITINENGSINKKSSDLCQRLYLKETNGSHIHGFGVADKITQLSGLEYNEEETNRMVKAVNEDTNVRMKTREGNMRGARTAPKNSGDLAVDEVIINALDKVKNTDKPVILAENVAVRASRIIKDILDGDYSVEYKLNARELFTNLKNENGQKVVRSNAKMSMPRGKEEYHVTYKKETKSSLDPVVKTLFPAQEATDVKSVGVAEDTIPFKSLLKKDGTPDMRRRANKNKLVSPPKPPIATLKDMGSKKKENNESHKNSNELENNESHKNSNELENNESHKNSNELENNEAHKNSNELENNESHKNSNELENNE